MAGDWIKMRSDLATDPAVIRIGTATGLDSFAVVGRLHALWAWADKHTADGDAPGVSVPWLSHFLSHDGFAEALAAAGWLVVTEGGIRLPKFTRHMGQAAKKRATEADRKRTYRKRDVSRFCPAPVPLSVPPETGQCPKKSGTREEKSREEKSQEDKTPPPPAEPGGRSVGRPDAIPFDPLRADQDARKRFEGLWAAAGLRRFSRLSPTLQSQLQALLLDPWWAEHYPAALERAGRIPFLRDGLGRDQGPLDVAAFLRDGDFVRKLIDGVYDPRPAGGGKPGKETPEEMVARLQRERDQRRKAG